MRWNGAWRPLGSPHQFAHRLRFENTQTATYDKLGIFTPHSPTGQPPVTRKRPKNLQSNPDPPTIEAAQAKDSPPHPFRKEIRTKGLVGNPHVLSQAGMASRASAARGKISADVRGMEARSARNMMRYAERQQQTMDVVGDRLQCPVCDRRFKSSQYARTHYIDMLV